MLTRNQIHLFHYKLRHCRVGPRATGLSQGICHWGAAWLSTSHIVFCTIILSPSPSLLSQLMACFQGTNCLSLPVFFFFFLAKPTGLTPKLRALLPRTFPRVKQMVFNIFTFSSVKERTSEEPHAPDKLDLHPWPAQERDSFYTADWHGFQTLQVNAWISAAGSQLRSSHCSHPQKSILLTGQQNHQ